MSSLDFLMVLDTGSDLFWLPCKCSSCFTHLNTSNEGNVFKRTMQILKLMFSPMKSTGWFLFWLTFYNMFCLSFYCLFSSFLSISSLSFCYFLSLIIGQKNQGERGTAKFGTLLCFGFPSKLCFGQRYLLVFIVAMVLLFELYE